MYRDAESFFPSPSIQVLESSEQSLKNTNDEIDASDRNLVQFEIEDDTPFSSPVSDHRSHTYILSVIHPEDLFTKIWFGLSLAFTLYNLVRVPYQMAFCIHGPTCSLDNVFTVTLDGIIDIFFIFDILVQFRLGFYYQGQVIMNRDMIRKKYFSKWFKYDLVASIPLDIPLLLAGISNPFIRINKMFRLKRFMSYFSELETSPRTSMFAIQNIKIQVYGFLLVHFGACGWIMIGQYFGYGNGPWVISERIGSRDNVEIYIHSLFWSLALLSRMTLKSPPDRTIENIYTIVMLVLGVFGFAYLVGRFSRDTFHRFRYELNFLRFRSEVAFFLRHHKAPKTIQETVYQYLQYCQNNPLEIPNGPEFDFINNLSEALYSDVRLVLYKSIVDKCSLFNELEPCLISAILSISSENLLIPGQYVYRKDENASDIYFVKKGKIILSTTPPPSERRVVVTNGSCFGLLAFIKGRHKWETNARVNEKGFASVLVINVEMLNKVLLAYPRSKQQFYDNISRLNVSQTLGTTCIDDIEEINPREEENAQKESMFWYLHPLSKRRRIWDFFVSMSILYNIVVVPLRISFADESFWTLSSLLSFAIFDIVSDGLLFIDIWVSFHKAFFSDGILICTKYEISQRYMFHHYLLFWDSFSVFPSDYIGWVVIMFTYVLNPSASISFRLISWLRLNRIFRISDLFSNISSFLVYNVRSSTALLISFFTIYLIFVHNAACFYFLFSRFDGFGSDVNTSWLPPESLKAASVTERYSFSVYFVFNTILVLGSGVYPDTTPQTLYSLFLLWFGAYFGSFLIGAIGTFLVTPDENRFYFTRKLESVRKVLKHFYVSHHVRDRVRQHLLYQWDASEGIDPNELLAKLPLVLRRRILQHIAGEFMSKIPFLANQPDSVIREILPFVKIQFIPKDEPIFFAGDLASSVYYIVEGQVQIVQNVGSDLGKYAISPVLRRSYGGNSHWKMHVVHIGNYFGEVDVLSDNIQQHLSSARTLTPCQLLVLSASDVSHILKSGSPSGDVDISKECEHILAVEDSSSNLVKRVSDSGLQN